MSFVLRIAIAFIILLGLQYLFLRLLSRALKTTFPNMNLRTYRLIRLSLIIILNAYPLVLLIYTLTMGTRGIPESSVIDYGLIYPFWTYILIMMQTLLFILLVKIAKLLSWPMYKKRREHYFSIEQKVILGLFIFTILYVPVRVLYDYNTIEVVEIVYEKEGLNPLLKDFKLVFISDTQSDRYTDNKRLGNFVNKVNEQNPDLIVMGGDIITSTPKYIDSAAILLGKLKAKYGVYTCLGDHDHWAYREDTDRSIREVTAALSTKNLAMIHNRNISINHNGADLNFTFLTNTYVNRSGDALNRLIIKDKKDLKVLVTHQPGNVAMNLSSARKYDLFLAGHTHGGQITFLFPFKNLSPTLFETRFVKGEFWSGSMLIYISRGLGMSLIPMRLNSTPEITVFRFSDKK